MTMHKEDLNNLSCKLRKRSIAFFNGFNEVFLTLAPFMLIIVTIGLMYFFRDAIAGDMNSISLIIALFSFSFGVLLAVNQYSLKAKAEKVEHEVRLMNLFSEIMETAHARGEAFVVNNEIRNAPIGAAAQKNGNIWP
jgi:hypothetical protein